MPHYWCANFNPGDDAYERVDYGFENNLWLMQYQYEEQRTGVVTQNWNVAKGVHPGDWLVAYVGRPARAFAVGRVRKPRLPADHTGSVQTTTRSKRHTFTDGIVHYSDAPAFYENLSNGNGFKRAWGQRVDVEEWKLINRKGVRLPRGLQDQALGFPLLALVEIPEPYFHAIERELQMTAKKIEIVLEDAARILQIIPQIILHGPPGTGKTYTAKRLAAHILGIPSAAVDKEEQGEEGDFHKARFAHGAPAKCWELVQFHPAYAYDDFIRGIQAEALGQSINYKVVRRVLDRLVDHSSKQGKTAVLIIDEINRANLAQVLGELIYGLEYRGSEIETPYAVDGKATLMVPRKGFYLIGTMNTADRSIGRIDYAVRRRFAFLQLKPDRSVITGQENIPEHDRAWAEKLFSSVAALFADDAAGNATKYLAPEFHPDDVQVGHTYFLGDHERVLVRFVHQVWPLLREYYKDGILLLNQEGKILLTLPGSEQIDVSRDIDTSSLLSMTDSSWRKAAK